MASVGTKQLDYSTSGDEFQLMYCITSNSMETDIILIFNRMELEGGIQLIFMCIAKNNCFVDIEPYERQISFDQQ